MNSRRRTIRFSVFGWSTSANGGSKRLLVSFSAGRTVLKPIELSGFGLCRFDWREFSPRKNGNSLNTSPFRRRPPSGSGTHLQWLLFYRRRRLTNQNISRRRQSCRKCGRERSNRSLTSRWNARNGQTLRLSYACAARPRPTRRRRTLTFLCRRRSGGHEKRVRIGRFFRSTTPNSANSTSRSSPL